MKTFPSHLLLAVTSCGLLAACDPSTGGFDPQDATESAAAVLTAIQQSPALQALSVMGSDITVSASAPIVGAALPDANFVRGRLAAWAHAGTATLSLAPRAAAAPIFPADLLGKTLTYNLGQRRYELSSQTGAPSTGVRFILYAVDPVMRRVVEPLNPVGHLDLTDKSTPAAAILGVTIVINNTTLVDYDAAASFPTGSITFSANGSISDGKTNVDFGLNQRITDGPAITVDYLLTVPENDVSLNLNAQISSSGSDVGLSVEHGNNMTVVHAVGDDSAITGTVSHNGVTVVNISGTPEKPVFTTTTGDPLPAPQVETLKRLFDLADALFDAFDDLLGPAHRLLGFPLLS